MAKYYRSKTAFSVTFLAMALLSPGASAQDGMALEQEQERKDLQQMRDEIQGVKSEVNEALEQMGQLKDQVSSSAVREFHLFVKRATCEIAAGININCLTYNGKLPGPVLRAVEGERVRVVLHNQSDLPTSLLFQGLLLPQNVGGLPKKEAGLVAPGQSYAYQFVAKQSGTFFYHPQVNHAEQKTEGLSGMLIVEPAPSNKAFDKEIDVVLSDIAARAATHSALNAVPPQTANSQHYYLFNGKTAPAIAPIELTSGERLRLRLINAGQESIPLSLSGHRFELISSNGSDPLEPHIFRDTVTLNPSDRYDLELTASNPGVWSLSSERYDQSTADGKFPGGIACVVRYRESKP